MTTTNNNTFAPICMAERYWINSQFSIARFYGGCKIGGHEYLIVNKDGKDLWQCTAEANRRGNTLAIMPGEPADLLRKDFVKHYRRLGRDRFLEVLKQNQRTSDKELQKIFKNLKND